MESTVTVHDVLHRLGLGIYTQRCIEQGFDTWQTLMDISEQDFQKMDIKLGHRRMIQREIATCRGVDVKIPLPRDESTSDVSVQTDLEASPEPGTGDYRTQSVSSDKNLTKAAVTPVKRRYRRHPKVDENAPERPPSAYVMFANAIRDEVKDQNYSFTEIARIVGDRWKSISTAAKEDLESKAGSLKERFLAQVVEYRKTPEFQQYQDYLTEFRQKMLADQKPERVVAPKRAKRENSTDLIMANSSTTNGGHSAPNGNSITLRPIENEMCQDQNMAATPSRTSIGSGESSTSSLADITQSNLLIRLGDTSPVLSRNLYSLSSILAPTENPPSSARSEVLRKPQLGTPYFQQRIPNGIAGGGGVLDRGGNEVMYQQQQQQEIRPLETYSWGNSDAQQLRQSGPAGAYPSV